MGGLGVGGGAARFREFGAVDQRANSVGVAEAEQADAHHQHHARIPTRRDDGQHHKEGVAHQKKTKRTQHQK